MNTNPFDPAVTASTGDVWAETVNPNATYTPMTLAPGQTGTITLTFTPSAPKGTVVRGFNIDLAGTGWQVGWKTGSASSPPAT